MCLCTLKKKKTLTTKAPKNLIWIFLLSLLTFKNVPNFIFKEYFFILQYAGILQKHPGYIVGRGMQRGKFQPKVVFGAQNQHLE